MFFINNQNTNLLSYITFVNDAVGVINRKVETSEYSELLRWGIKTGYAYVKEYKDNQEQQVHSKSKFHVFARDRVTFSMISNNASPLDIYIYENEIKTEDDLKEPRLLVFSNRDWLIRGLWEFDIDSYFHNLKGIKTKLEEEELRKKTITITRKQEEESDLIGRVERGYYEKLQPTVKLLGNNPIELPINFTYFEHGAIAFDMYNKDITDNINIQSNLNNTRKGTYYVDYYARDDYENIGKATRKVIVV